MDMPGTVSQTSDESFGLRVLKTFVEENFCVSEVFPCRETLRIRGRYHVFLTETFYLTILQNYAEGAFCVSIMFMHRRGKLRSSVGDFLSHTTEKLRGGTLLFCRKILVSKNFCLGVGYHVFLSKIFCLTVEKKS